ncbi:MAG: hydrogenase expression/formation protein HypE [Candidatus Jettenia sp.]|uniref:Hydrogenase expression/formation protein n=1 Tax=Candidatus Jettenia caeni TaxID=247490 RepID=I3IGJ3_9BACT|nr:hydrogenase expression/formation protein HypE [Candidatus Jettenia sp. AMX1]MBC6929797.1 hydrogenase expression/formation protein HypE [Candidatus Jettenia sp.]NUN22541.1 hydrogenase expression/formation protein HypE [Candidatus Jettenia caeni]KAA0248767.1 MAG: hydrogenase expression/formation protein HypE [Candidatus Jettenia sp. AMX1]MCE7881388.1 hydrogenase expression/formation protein HypE [Candidatus Jettenia sp. AMX1]MCQ3927969.1 hydrogenase expression/formation protein HypE [Candidat
MNQERILLSHGSGGKLGYQLIHEIFLKAFYNEFLSPLNDQAIFNLPTSRLAFTTDSYVVNPIFFPGGDIGKLSVCGTVNDLAVGGAEPLYLSASFIIEEGILIEELRMIVDSMAQTANHAKVKIITGDTKVVERGKGDKLFINTSGIGIVKDGIHLSPLLIKPGDAILVSGHLGDHGIAIMCHREGIQMETPVQSDCAALHELVQDVISRSNGIRAMRDPTRGGLATTLNELAASSGYGMIIKEEDIPVKEEVKGACEILGFDPLYLANEGKLIAIVSKDSAGTVLEVMRKNPLGRDASLIGTVVDEPRGKVLLETSIGNRRILDMLSGEQLPRIC